MPVRDVLIVGAGPSGLATAIAAKQQGLDYAIVEKGVLVNSIFNFPMHMVFFTTPELLEIGGLPLVTPYDKPTRLEDLTAYRVNGTPADCVSLGAYHWEKVDIVLSGLNHGFNLGNSIWHSGTVAAAKQAALLGLRGVALSAPAGADSVADFEPLKPWIRQVLNTLLSEVDLPLVNVNFPRHPRGAIWTRASVRRYDGKVVPTQDPSGRRLFWFTVTPIEGAEEGTDRWAMEQGWVSLTPLPVMLRQMGYSSAIKEYISSPAGRKPSLSGMTRNPGSADRAPR